MCRRFVDDMIDFPTSDAFRDHYYEMGLTPHHSPSYSGCRDLMLDRLERERRQMERDLVEMSDRTAELRERVERQQPRERETFNWRSLKSQQQSPAPAALSDKQRGVIDL